MVESVGDPGDEQGLIARSRQGDREAQAALFSRYQEAVVRWAERVVKRTEDAQDIAQDVFLKVFQHLPKYRGESAFSVWIYRITYNLSLNFLQRVQRRQVPLEDHHLEGLTADSPISDPGGLVASARDEAALAAIQQLPPHYQLVITLYYFEDRSYQDIADILNIPLNTVKTHLRRAKALIAGSLRTPNSFS